MKRLSNNRHKNHHRKIKIKSLQRIETSGAETVEFSSHQTNIIFTYLLTGVVFLNFFSPFAQATPSAVIYKPEKNNQLSQAKAPTISLAAEHLANLDKADKLNEDIVSIIKNTPMEVMASDISKKDRAVAAFIVGIAMKESKFGTYAPKKNGADCYNYWGYRGKENTTASGYSCFDSPSHAISVVGNKIESMVDRGAKTPASMISWKCGSTCAGHDPVSVDKWIADVGIHYYQLTSGKEIAKKD